MGILFSFYNFDHFSLTKYLFQQFEFTLKFVSFAFLFFLLFYCFQHLKVSKWVYRNFRILCKIVFLYCFKSILLF